MSENITRAELCRRAAERIDKPKMSERAVGVAVDAFLIVLQEALASGGRVELRGLGSFRIVKWAARRVKPPRGPHQKAKPGGVRAVKAAFSVRFRAGRWLRAMREGV